MAYCVADQGPGQCNYDRAWAVELALALLVLSAVRAVLEGALRICWVSPAPDSQTAEGGDLVRTIVGGRKAVDLRRIADTRACVADHFCPHNFQSLTGAVKSDREPASHMGARPKSASRSLLNFLRWAASTKCPTPGDVVELGCGTGAMAHDFYRAERWRMGAAARVLGLDSNFKGPCRESAPVARDEDMEILTDTDTGSQIWSEGDEGEASPARSVASSPSGGRSPQSDSDEQGSTPSNDGLPESADAGAAEGPSFFKTDMGTLTQTLVSENRPVGGCSMVYAVDAACYADTVEKRDRLFRQAWDALLPGGLFVVVDMFRGPQARASKAEETGMQLLAWALRLECFHSAEAWGMKGQTHGFALEQITDASHLVRDHWAYAHRAASLAHQIPLAGRWLADLFAPPRFVGKVSQDADLLARMLAYPLYTRGVLTYERIVFVKPRRPARSRSVGRS